jgi:hypothetical protein
MDDDKDGTLTKEEVQQALIRVRRALPRGFLASAHAATSVQAGYGGQAAIAPVGLLLTRAGRVWRLTHTARAQGMMLHGQDPPCTLRNYCKPSRAFRVPGEPISRRVHRGVDIGITRQRGYPVSANASAGGALRGSRAPDHD